MDQRCPRKLKEHPCAPCQEGKKAIDAARKGKVGGCPWFVSDSESNYCFFKYMDDDGRSIPTHRIARLQMIDDSEVKRVIQSFRRKVPWLFQVENPEDIF